MHNKFRKFTLFFLLCPIIALAEFSFTQEPLLSGNDGGYTNGDEWRLSDHAGLVTVLFYLDPDERSLNEELEARLEKENFPLRKSCSVVVINTKQSWLPNFVIENAIKKKQKSHPKSIFVFDKSNVLMKTLGLPKPGYLVLLLNVNGDILFHHQGRFNNSEINQLISLIWNEINSNQNIAK